VFETGAILIYLAEKTGRFLPKRHARSFQGNPVGDVADGRARSDARQHGHFALYAPEKIPYAIERYRDEAARLYGVLDRQLQRTGAYVAGDYSICRHRMLPVDHDPQGAGFTLDDYPGVKRWYADVRARPQVQAGLAVGKFVKEPLDEEARKNMFGQAAKALSGSATQ